MHLVDMISQDVRQAIRALARTPGFTATAVVTLALGIGAVTTMFSVANTALVRPLPFERAHELYQVTKIAPGGGGLGLSIPELQEWQSQNRSFPALAGSAGFDFNLRGYPPAAIIATAVTPGYLELLGADMHIGRRFAEAEYEPGSDWVVLLTYPFWQQRFAADPAVIGKTLDLEGPFHLSDSTGPYTIVGILAPEFWHFYDRTRTHLVLPLRASAAQMGDRNVRLVERVIGRLTDRSAPLAAQDLRTISARHDREFLRSAADVSVEVTPLAEAHFGTIRSSLTLLLAATFVVALIASANVVLGARIAPRDTGNQPRGSAGYQGAEPFGWFSRGSARGRKSALGAGCANEWVHVWNFGEQDLTTQNRSCSSGRIPVRAWA